MDGMRCIVDSVCMDISFLFVGLMMASSTRSFLLQLTKLMHRFSANMSYNGAVLFLAHVMGTYFLASVLLLRTNLPPQYGCVCWRWLPFRRSFVY
jgi:hypothetical protein